MTRKQLTKHLRSLFPFAERFMVGGSVDGIVMAYWKDCRWASDLSRNRSRAVGTFKNGVFEAFQ